MKKILVMASGNGSNFEATVKYFNASNSCVKVEIELLCNIKDAPVLKKAENLGIRAYFVPFSTTYNFLCNRSYDLYVLAGYMRILPPQILKLGTFINIHPSLLPEFKGMDAILRAYESGVKKTGVTVHYVAQEVDSGEIIAQKECEILPDMTLEELECEIHKIEHVLYPKVIEELLK